MASLILLTLLFTICFNLRDLKKIGYFWAFVGKESTFNAGDPASIPGLGRYPGEGIGYPLQYSWASLVVHLVKNPPAMWETWVQSLGCKIHWRREKLPNPLFQPGKFYGLHSLWGCKESDTTERLLLTHYFGENTARKLIYFPLRNKILFLLEHFRFAIKINRRK